MKNWHTLLLFALVLLGSASASLRAHEEEELGSSRSFKIGINGPYALFGAFIATSEFRVGNRTSVLARLGYIDPRLSVNPNIAPLEGPSAAGKVGFGLRQYWHKCAMDGLYAEGNIDTDVTGTLSLRQETVDGIGRVGPFTWRLYASFYAGYSWVSDLGFFADVGLGVELGAVVLGEPDLIQQINTITQPVPRINIGWSF